MRTVFFSIFICCIPSLVLAQIPADKLKAFYPLNGNANDESGNENHGSVNGATLTNDRFGNVDAAYLFNGTSDYIEIEDFSAIDDSSELSISMWAKAEANTSNCMLMLSPDDNSDRCVTCAQFKGNIYWDYGNIFSDGRMHIGNIPFDTLWHHYVYAISFEKNIKQVYMDGILLKSDTGSIGSGLVNKKRDLWIGGGTDANPGSIRFKGKIDDIRIYADFLTQNEVKYLNFESPCKLTITDTVHIPVYDTLTITDTVHVAVYDTVTVTDTVHVTVYDSLSVTDTVHVTVYDTVTVTDTLFINTIISGETSDVETEILVYPNPSSNFFTIKFQSNLIDKNYSINIIDSSGSIRYSSLITMNETIINYETLGAHGIYFLRILDSQGNILEVRKIILN